VPPHFLRHIAAPGCRAPVAPSYRIFATTTVRKVTDLKRQL